MNTCHRQARVPSARGPPRTHSGSTISSFTRTWKGRANGPGSTASDRCQGARPAAGADTWKSLILRFLTLLLGSVVARLINADWIRQVWEWIREGSHSH